MRNTLLASMIFLAVGAGAATAAGQLGGVVDAAKQTGEVTKDAAKTATETVTGKAQAKCKDGTTQTAKTVKAASAVCAKHGGVAK